MKVKLRGKAVYKGENELTADIRYRRKTADVVTKLAAVEGVSSAVMVEYTGE